MEHSNTVEGDVSVFNRGVTGIHQHCSEARLHRYLSEFVYGILAVLPLA